MAAIGAVAVNGLKLGGGVSQSYLHSNVVNGTKVLVASVCRHDGYITRSQQPVFMSSSVVQKERMEPDDMYALSSNVSITSSPKCSDWAPRFMKNISKSRMLPLRKWSRHTTYKPSMRGGESPVQNVKDVLNNSNKANVSVKAGTTDSSHNFEPQRRCIVLDIEGTATPISFVTDILFPYARSNVGRHLTETYSTADTQEDIQLLRSQVKEDLEKGVSGAVNIPSNDAGKEKVIAALVANVDAMIRADRKITALKQLQGHIWKTGFENNELEGVVFEDVPEALEKWHSSGTKVYIYSSGSRLAQRLIFGNTNYGDLRKYLSGFFDTTVGNKRESQSYIEISESLGVDNPSEILFITDVFQEAIAAKDAGLEVIVSIRPGNGPLPENHGFKTINSFLEI